MMEFTEALSQIAEIHDHLVKGEVFRGFRSAPIALSGACGLLAAALQGQVVSASDPLGAVVYWAGAALVAGAVGASELAFNYVFREDPFARRRTRRVVGQFLPCLAAGTAVTIGLLRIGEALVGLLPGLWSILFALGIFAARPYLPRAIGWVALFYLVAGFRWLCLAQENDGFSPWAVGGTFAAGQWAAALVLYWNLERRDHA
jgi:hypothetical protein